MKKIQIKIILILAKVIVTALFVWAVYNSVESFNTLFSHVSASMILVALLFSAVMQFIHIHRWQLALKLEGTPFSFKQCTKSYFVGALLGVVSPGRIGEILRFYFLPGLPKKRALYALLLDRLVLMSSLAIVGGLAVLSYGSSFFSIDIPSFFTSENLRLILLIAASVGICIMIAGKVVIEKTLNTTAKNHHYASLIFESLGVNVILMIQSAVLFISLMGWGVLSGARVTAASYASMQLAPITVANLGTREFFLSLFAKFENGLQSSVINGHDEALIVAMIVVVTNLLVPALPGLYLLLRDKIRGQISLS